MSGPRKTAPGTPREPRQDPSETPARDLDVRTGRPYKTSLPPDPHEAPAREAEVPPPPAPKPEESAD